MNNSRTSKSSGVVIGWREWVELPDLGIEQVKVKVDTGARSSSLHAFDIEYETRGRTKYVTFKVHPRQRMSEPVFFCRAPLHDVRLIKSSNGVVQKRPVIRTTLKIGQLEREIDLTLTSRDEMGFRMLLGREAMRKQFVVDPGASFRFGRIASWPTTKKPAKKQKVKTIRRGER